MTGRFRHSLVSLVLMLRRFEENPEQLSLLYDAQRKLVQRIKYLEKRIAQTKRQQKLLKSARKSGELSRLQYKQSASQLISKIKRYQYLLFCFRHVGDGFAHILFNKWDIKPLSSKESSGNLTGRVGLQKELSALRFMIKRGFPAIFTDLTNCLRHGDLCLSLDGAPLIGEVKSSENVNARVCRQIKAIESLQNYLIEDQAEDLYGMNIVKRVFLELPEIDHRDSLNNLIQDARKVGHAICDVEPGLRYAVFWRDSGMQILDRLVGNMKMPMPFFLNAAKDAASWTPYYPFVLSIRDPNDVVAFIEGDLMLFVIVDQSEIPDQSNALGCSVEPVREPFLGLHFKPTQDGSTTSGCVVSGHFFNRIAFEFLSLQWLVSVSCCKACSA